MRTKFWIEKNWGQSVDNATLQDARIAIAQILSRPGEQALFWLGHTDQEYVLEIQNTLEVVFTYGENQDKKIKAKLFTWEQCQHLVEMYFAQDFLSLKNQIECTAMCLN